MTANMTNRDAKGKFVKAGLIDPADFAPIPAPQTFKEGDVVRVSRCRSDYEYFSAGDIGTVLVGGTNEALVDFTKTGVHPRNKQVKGRGAWWVGEDSGQSSMELAPAELQPAPAPCPFKVGDRVSHLHCRPNEIGKIRDIGQNGTISVHWLEGDYGSVERPSVLRKVEDAPAKPCRVDVDLLIYERDGLLDEVSRLKTEAKERANTYSQNVQSLKDELTSAHDATNFEHSALLDARKQLEDIAALRRSMAIFAITGSREGYGPFNNAIDAVLEGRVA